MACSAVGKLRWGSCVVLLLGFAAWVIALGGLGAINWLVCSDTANTIASIAESYANAPSAGNVTAAVLNVPPPGTDLALCARSWRWEWWTLFFEFAIVASALVVTGMPERLVRARFPIANFLSIASVLIMVALNNNITDVWFFWDTHRNFAEWAGVLQKLYFSAAALVAGWVMVVFFNLVWIGFALDACCAGEGKKKGDDEAAHATADVEAAAGHK